MCNNPKNFSRREFMKFMAAGAGTVLASKLHLPGSGLAHASPLGRNVVVIYCAGGKSLLDVMNYSSANFDAHPTLMYAPEDSLPVNAQWGFHPSLNFLSQEYARGNLAVFHASGYPTNTRSHAIDTAAYMTQTLGSTTGPGFGSRIACQESSALQVMSTSGFNKYTQGICESTNINSISNLSEGRVANNTLRTREYKNARTAVMGLSDSENKVKNFLTQQKSAYEKSADYILSRTSTPLANENQYANTGLQRDLRDIAKLIRAGITSNFITVKGGFDTHSRQKTSFENLLLDIDGGLNAFVQSLQDIGAYNDTTIVLMSEFGRTKENGNDIPGTDHGRAQNIHVLGGEVNGGSYGELASAAQLSNPYVREINYDIRQIMDAVTARSGYTSVIEEQYETSPLTLYTT